VCVPYAEELQDYLSNRPGGGGGGGAWTGRKKVDGQNALADPVKHDFFAACSSGTKAGFMSVRVMLQVLGDEKAKA